MDLSSFSVHGCQRRHHHHHHHASQPNELLRPDPIPPTSRRRKHGDSAVAALRRRNTRSNHSGYCPAVNFGHCFRKSEVTARKLAAGLWQLQSMEVSGDGGASSMSQLANGNVRITLPHHLNSREKRRGTKDPPRRQVTIFRSRNGLLCELISSMQYLKCSKEEATKWDPALAEPFNDFTKIHSRKLLEDGKLVGDHDSIVTALLEELRRAQTSINKLKAAQKSSKKKVEQFLQNLEEENVSWKHRQRQKIQATVDDLKDKLARERRSKERMELLNAKLVRELAEANLSANQFMTKYEKEKKERELTEEVCNELAMQIGEDRTKLEGVLRDSSKICEEVQEERKMMQLAELWREERVQMKLVDAKLVLEEKYSQMVQLIDYLQMFLKSRGAELGATELGDAQVIKKAVESVNIQRIVELSYDFSKTNETLLMLEEHRKLDSAGPLSTIHIASLDEERLNKNFVLHQPSPSSDYNTALKLTNLSETVGRVEDRKFSSPPHRRDTNLINVSQGKNILGNKAKCSEEAMNVVCGVSAGQSKCKDSPASKLPWPCPSGGTTSSSTKTSQHKRPGEANGRHKHKDSAAKQNSADVNCGQCYLRRFSAGSVLSGGPTTSRCEGSVEGSFRHPEELGQRRSRETMNPHVTRGIRGCVEWPRGIPKANSKVIPLEERVRSQKSQMQNILKPKA